MDSEMGLSGKTVLVVGTGISGIAAVNLLATQSANIILLDGNTELSPETVAAKFSEDIHYDLILGRSAGSGDGSDRFGSVKPRCADGSAVCGTYAGGGHSNLGRDRACLCMW